MDDDRKEYIDQLKSEIDPIEEWPLAKLKKAVQEDGSENTQSRDDIELD